MVNKSQISFQEFKIACTSYISKHDHHSRSTQSQDFGPHQYSKGWTWIENPAFPRAAHLFRRFSLIDQPTSLYSIASNEVAPVSESDSGRVQRGETAQEDDAESSILRDMPDDDLEDEDAATHLGDRPSSMDTSILPSDSSGSKPRLIRVEQSIVYSSTWRVPVLYFSACSNEGVPLSLSQISRSSIFVKPQASTLPFETLTDDTQISLKEVSSHRKSIDPDPDQSVGETATFASLSQGEHPVTSLSSFYLHPCETAAFMETIRSHESHYTTFKENDEEVSEMAGYLETFVMLCSSALEMKNF